MTALLRICVFCGSREGARPAYTAAARALGEELAARRIGLVYGGATVGLMGAVADAVMAAGGEVDGVIPAVLVERELAHGRVTRLHTVRTMHERKARMAEMSDGFVALPGGTGTLDELFEIITWAQLGIHAHPVGLLDVEGYWQPLLAFLRHATTEGFIRPGDVARDEDGSGAVALCDTRPGALLDRMAAAATARRAPLGLSSA